MQPRTHVRSYGEVGKDGFGLGGLADGKEERDVIDALSRGGGLAASGVMGEGGEQFARAIIGDGLREGLLLVGREGKLIEVQHRGIIKSPLQNIVHHEAGGQRGYLPGNCDRLLHIGHRNSALLVFEPDDAVDH